MKITPLIWCNPVTLNKSKTPVLLIVSLLFILAYMLIYREATCKMKFLLYSPQLVRKQKIEIVVYFVKKCNIWTYYCRCCYERLRKIRTSRLRRYIFNWACKIMMGRYLAFLLRSHYPALSADYFTQLYLCVDYVPMDSIFLFLFYVITVALTTNNL